MDVVDVALYTRHWMRHFIIQWAVWFWSAITFAVVAVICFSQHFRTMFFNDVSDAGGTAIAKCLSGKFYGICCSWTSASSQVWWTVYQHLF